MHNVFMNVVLLYSDHRHVSASHVAIFIVVSTTTRSSLLCTWWRSWLRHCATSRKVAGSIPDGVIGIFHCHNPSGRTMALGLTQPLTEMSTRNISWVVKAAGVWGWQPYHLHVLIVLKSGSLNLLEHSGSIQACNGNCFTFMKPEYILLVTAGANLGLGRLGSCLGR